MSKIALILGFVSVALLGCGGGGGGGGTAGNGNGMMPPPAPSVMRDFSTGTPSLADRTGDTGDDTFTIAGDITGNTPALTLGTIDGAGGSDEVQLNAGATVASIAFSGDDPTGGALHLQNVETITINGGTVNGAIDASAATADVTFNLNSETVGSNDSSNRAVVSGGSGNDIFNIGAGQQILLIGGDGEDEVRLNEGTFESITAPGTPEGVDTSDRLLLRADSSIEIITFEGGIVDTIMLTPEDDLTFNLNSGMITGILRTGAGDDTFILSEAFSFGDEFIQIDGGTGMDTFMLAAGFTPDAASFDRGSNVLTLTISDSETLTLTLTNIEIVLPDFAALTVTAPALTLTAATTGADTFMIANNIVGNTRTHTLDRVINGGTGDDTLQLDADAVVADIFFGTAAPTGGDVHLQDVEIITINGGTVNGAIDASAAPRNPIALPIAINGVTINLISGTITGNIIGSDHNDLFVLSGDITSGSPAITFGLIDSGGSTNDQLRLDGGAVVSSISFSSTAPDAGSGALHLRRVKTIHINGGRVNGNITGSDEGIIFVLQSGTITGNVIGGDGVDTFNLYSAAIFTNADSYIDGGANIIAGENLGADGLVYAGASGFDFAPRSGLAADTNVRDGGGSVRDIETQVNAGAITSLSVRNIERLELSPALNLYGALSDALMQFGQQTAEGFALADLNPQTGRLTQLISKDSPFTKGRIWAHKITHSGNGKGSIGLGITGLTARAPSDYDYEMSLTQHGFDAPLVSSQWGDFGLRAVSHTMTGMIETNTAEAQVSGYGAGLAWLWRGSERSSRERHHNGLSANLTTLAGAYEVDAHTSPSNPQAVVNEVSEGSFSAINAVISAGIADKRELTNGLVMRTTADVSWQTLSLDDFTETGENGIIVNFDKATRFTARIGTGLESEHWFSDLAFVHQTSSGGTLSSGLRQDYRQHDGTAIEMKFGGKIADLAPGLTIKAFAVWRQSVAGLAGEPSAQFELSYRF